MKWLVLGNRGWIGGQVVALLESKGEQVLTTSVRADDDDGIRAILIHEKPDRVVSLIGRTHGEGFSTIDYLEQKGKLVENVRDNLYGPLVLAHLCKEYNIHLTYLGTGCIFNFDDSHTTETGFDENEKPNFFGSSYSVVKGFTDRLMHLFKDSVLNVRIRMPITGDMHPRNFITKITSYQKICSIPNSMTVLPELLPIMIDMAANKITGTVNLTNPGVIDHNEILTLYKEIVDPTFTWENFDIEEQRKVLLSDRSNNYLDTKTLQSLYPQVKNIRDSIIDVLHQLKRDPKIEVSTISHRTASK